MTYRPVPRHEFRIPSGLKERAKVLASKTAFKKAFQERWHPKWFEELVRAHDGQKELVLHAGVRLLVVQGTPYASLMKEHAALYVAMRQLAKEKQTKAKTIWYTHGGT